MLIWNGTAWVIPNAPAQNPTGLELVKTQTLGSGVGTTSVTDVFSSNYDNYKIVISGGVASGTILINLHMGTTLPANGYFSSRIINAPNNGTPTGNGINNATVWSYAGQASSNLVNMNVDLFSPFLPRYTAYNGSYILDAGAGSEIGISQGFVANTTSFTAFTIVPSGTITGATIRVYGYRN
jgi:hypothetical protein